MDSVAKDYWQDLKEQGFPMTPPVQPVLHEGWTISHHGTKIPSPNKNILYPIIRDPKILEHWCKPHTGMQPTPRLSLEALDLIDWQASRWAMTALKPGHCRWVTKHASENCGVSMTLHYWNKRTDEECPRGCEPRSITSWFLW